MRALRVLSNRSTFGRAYEQGRLIYARLILSGRPRSPAGNGAGLAWDHFEHAKIDFPRSRAWPDGECAQPASRAQERRPATHAGSHLRVRVRSRLRMLHVWSWFCALNVRACVAESGFD